MRQLLSLVALGLTFWGCADPPIVAADGEIVPIDSPGTVSASIVGTRWESKRPSTEAIGGPAGSFTITAFDSTLAEPVGIVLSLYNIAKPGIYPIGVLPTVTGGSLDLLEGTKQFHTLLTANGGAVVVTRVSSTRIIGKFFVNFLFPTEFGAGGSDHPITDGAFDVPVQTTGAIEVPANRGGSMVGVVGKTSYRAADLIASKRGTSFTISAGNFDYVVAFSLINLTAPGIYALGPPEASGLTVRSQRDDWGGNPTLVSGNIVIVSISDSRITGTIDAVARPGPGSLNAGPIKVVLAFDAGLTP